MPNFSLIGPAYNWKVCYCSVGVAVCTLEVQLNVPLDYSLANLTVYINILWVWLDTRRRLLILLWSHGDQISSVSVIGDCQ